MTEPSFTALTAAAARAAHLIVDAGPKIFVDEFAAPLLGDRADELLAYHRHRGDHPVLAGARTQVLCRSRYAEARLGELTQCVVLGAGLDTFAHRAPAIRVFEVDLPHTQEWKRRQLAGSGLTEPASRTFVPLDLATGDLVEALVNHGFDLARPTLVTWLGVTMYLGEAAITRTLRAVAGLAPGTRLVADYFLPARLRDDAGAQYADAVSAVAAQGGEPWRSCFSPDELTELLRANGFTTVRHVHQRDHDVWPRPDALRPAELSVLADATV
ncbi:SAM-dependent methyltransferase [Amycolatopsis rhabdoformis]|uniref:S-adenosyl-L-methionine-dependent methyltransferase n=1 Tax=Amycolatopsis rhabdoformis TaxID=1448059 RepID=A0ABZ1IB46_9PSEU|nr:SAM-dependent methyltransferase [Amycolatopsis rhabdoformis]WSE31432.1 SAM-dependent methyltransferase [Amycolatopsis rhabdoformis]